MRDQEIATIIEKHGRWRADCWNLIASENITSPAVAALLSCDLSHRYGDYEGIDVGERKYRGNRFVVEIERLCQQRACKLFGARFADLRPLSGHIAGLAPIMALCGSGDAVLELDQNSGGHRLAGKLVNCPLVMLRALPLPFDIEQFNIDVRATLEVIERERPRIVVLGSSLFLFPHPVSQLRDGIRQLGCGAVIQYDASHVLGLIAGGRFQQPLAEGADVITSSTHKTLGGPQGGIILFASAELPEVVGRALQPGLLSNHHLHRLPALCQTFHEWTQAGGAPADQMIALARSLAASLERSGIPMVASELGYTASHTIIIQTARLGDASALAAHLESANIVAGACRLPGQLGPGGIRIGVQEMVRRGMLPEDADEMACVIAAVLQGHFDAQKAQRRVADLAGKLRLRVEQIIQSGTSHA